MSGGMEDAAREEREVREVRRVIRHLVDVTEGLFDPMFGRSRLSDELLDEFNLQLASCGIRLERRK